MAKILALFSLPTSVSVRALIVIQHLFARFDKNAALTYIRLLITRCVVV